MSVYRSTYALTKLFGITRAEGGLVDDDSVRAKYPFLGGLGQDVTRIGYSTRLKFADIMPSRQQLPRIDNIDTVLAENLAEINAFIRQLVDYHLKLADTFPIVITHNFTKGEIDIAAQSPQVTSIIENAISDDHGLYYRDMAWQVFVTLRTSSEDSAAIYLLNDSDSTVTALTNFSSLQLQIDAKP